jgi:UDP-N-acetylmuramoyl-L-alanyl-D-glutamate--2,6-diaminopimelate ligase
MDLFFGAEESPISRSFQATRNLGPNELESSAEGERTVKLGELVSRLPAKEIYGDPTVEVKGLAYHSQKVEEGFLFAAIPGLREDGMRFIPEALSRGACSILLGENLASVKAVQVVVPDVREALGRLAAAFYGDPSSLLTLVGITGTNGKTTTSYLIESILEAAGKRVGVLGTINYRFAGQIQPAPMTTPESLDLQRNLRAMRDAGITHAILEVSSHALDLQRVRGCDFDVALFTNLTRDHLDYHGSMESYFQAKKLLFTQCLSESKKGESCAVINLDDPKGEELSSMICGTFIGYGVKRHRHIWPEMVEETPDGLRARVHTPRGSYHLTSSLIGRHNLYNILAAVGVAEALKLSSETIAAGVERLIRVPGRLERIPGGEGIRVFVDYAHTGDALERALETLRRMLPARLIVVFGCGGDRDRGKRAVMGRVAALGSNLTVVTSDNPRSEDPLEIIEEVERGIRETGRKKYQAIDLGGGWSHSGYVVIPDRKEAIHLAIGVARPGDVVLIAGKGHEDYQILGGKKVHFDDREEAAVAMASLGEKKNG